MEGTDPGPWMLPWRHQGHLQALREEGAGGDRSPPEWWHCCPGILFPLGYGNLALPVRAVLQGAGLGWEPGVGTPGVRAMPTWAAGGPAEKGLGTLVAERLDMSWQLRGPWQWAGTSWALRSLPTQPFRDFPSSLMFPWWWALVCAGQSFPTLPPKPHPAAATQAGTPPRWPRGSLRGCVWGLWAPRGTQHGHPQQRVGLSGWGPRGGRPHPHPQLSPDTAPRCGCGRAASPPAAGQRKLPRCGAGH